MYRMTLIAGSDKVNALGFCVGGTLLGSALAVRRADGGHAPVLDVDGDDLDQWQGDFGVNALSDANGANDSARASVSTTTARPQSAMNRMVTEKPKAHAAVERRVDRTVN